MKLSQFKFDLPLNLIAQHPAKTREESRLMTGADKGTIINKAINETLSRTILTSLTVFLTILSLFIFGGEVTRGFAFAMLIGLWIQYEASFDAFHKNADRIALVRKNTLFNKVC